MRTKGRLLTWLGILCVAGCVSVEEPILQQGAIRQGQRSLLLVYSAPGPWVTSDQDTKVESAAKFLPGLGLVVQGAQDSRDLKSSKALEQYMPHYRPEEAFYPLLRSEIQKINYPGVWISSGAESETTQDLVDRFNRAADTLEWRSRYYTAEPEEVRSRRNYSTLLSVDDALVLEVNLQHGLLVLDDGNFIPSLSAMSRLYRAGTMKLLWYKEESVDDRGLPKAIEEFMTTPKILTDDYVKLMSSLAAKIANDLRPASAPPAAVSTGTVSGQPLASGTTPQAVVPAPKASAPGSVQTSTQAAVVQALAPASTGQAQTPPPPPQTSTAPVQTPAQPPAPAH